MFAANIAEAQDAEDVEQAIESIALPAGSYSIKRNSDCSIALNAYVGLSVGLDVVLENGALGWPSQTGASSDDDRSREEDNHLPLVSGIAAPVGLAFSWGLAEHSVSLFLSVIDVGRFAAYRLYERSEDRLEEGAETTLGDIFAPGSHFVWGLPKLPVSFGIGAQLEPPTRYVVNTNEGTTSGVSDTRIRNPKPLLNFKVELFAAVDIPLFNFYTKPH